MIDCPFTGQKVVAVRGLEPDVCLLHAHRADMYGNVQFFPRPIWTDVDVFPRASKKVIVTVEEIVDNEEIRRTPEHTGIPYFKVDAVVHVPYGSHPCSLFPTYAFDRKVFRKTYATASRCDQRRACVPGRILFSLPRWEAIPGKSGRHRSLARDSVKWD